MDHTETTTSYDIYENHLNSSLLLLDYKSKEFDVGELVYKCHNLSASDVWLGIKITSLTVGTPLNIAFFWLVMLSKNALTTYEVLCFNLASLDVVFSLCLPIDIYSAFHRPSESTLSAAEALSVCNLFSCPMLLASMCLERYLSVGKPDTHQALSQSKCRIGFSALVWLLMMVMGFVVYFEGVLSKVQALASVIGTFLVLGFLSLLGVACVMFKKGDGQAEGGDVPEPKAALKDVAAVLLPFAALYLPFLALDPFLVRLHAQGQLADTAHCHSVQALIAVSNFGVFIGPALYMPGAVKRVCCTTKEPDQTE